VQPQIPDPLFGVPVIPGEQERRIRTGSEERGVDDPSDTRGGDGAPITSRSSMPSPNVR